MTTKCISVSVSMPVEVLETIDAAAREMKVSRSRVVMDALRGRTTGATKPRGSGNAR